MRITAANGPLTDVYHVIPWYITAQWSTGAQGTFPPMVHWRKMLDRVVLAPCYPICQPSKQDVRVPGPLALITNNATFKFNLRRFLIILRLRVYWGEYIFTPFNTCHQSSIERERERERGGGGGLKQHPVADTGAICKQLAHQDKA